MPDLSGLIVLVWVAVGGAAMFAAALLAIPVAWVFGLSSIAVLTGICAVGIIATLAAAAFMR